MAKIIEKSENLDARQTFKMMTGSDLTKISDCNGRDFRQARRPALPLGQPLPAGVSERGGRDGRHQAEPTLR